MVYPTNDEETLPSTVSIDIYASGIARPDLGKHRERIEITR